MSPLPLFVNFNVFEALVLVRIYMVHYNHVRHEITCLRVLRTVESQANLLSNRDGLESLEIMTRAANNYCTDQHALI